MEDIDKKIESLLFAIAEPFKISELTKILNASTKDIEDGVAKLSARLQDSAIILIRNNEQITLATKPEYSELIEQIRKEEISKELSKSSAETLSVIIYRPGCSKSEIEMIRGVNASYAIRALQMRGLIEPRGTGRSITYHPTITLLEHFGVQSTKDLPKYEETKQKIESLLNIPQE